MCFLGTKRTRLSRHDKRGQRFHFIPQTAVRYGGVEPRAQHDCRCYSSHVSDPDVLNALRAFVAEREWSQFHTPENLAKSISIEAGELLEQFQWNPEFDSAEVRAELADVLTYCILLADRLDLDPNEIVLEKLAKTREKYPVEKSRGRSAKYDEL